MIDRKSPSGTVTRSASVDRTGPDCSSGWRWQQQQPQPAGVAACAIFRQHMVRDTTVNQASFNFQLPACELSARLTPPWNFSSAPACVQVTCEHRKRSAALV